MAQLWKLSQTDKATAAERNWVDRIHHAGKRLASVVERMLKLVRSDELARPLDVRPTLLEPMIRNTVGELSPFLSTRRQRVVLDLDPELGEAEIDAAKIGDVLTNLLINAIKFTADEGTIRIDARPEGLDHVKLSVIDEGIGIDPACSPFVFEPFFAGFDTMHHSSGEFEYCKARHRPGTVRGQAVRRAARRTRRGDEPSRRGFDLFRDPPSPLGSIADPFSEGTRPWPLRLTPTTNLWKRAAPFDYAWLDAPALSPIRRDFLPEDLEPLLNPRGIDRTIVVQTQHDTRENHWALALADQHAFIAGVVGWVDLASMDCARQIEEARDHPQIRGGPPRYPGRARR